MNKKILSRQVIGSWWVKVKHSFGRVLKRIPSLGWVLGICPWLLSTRTRAFQFHFNEADVASSEGRRNGDEKRRSEAPTQLEKRKGISGKEKGYMYPLLGIRFLAGSKLKIHYG
ncbi:hypothetical protein Vadar_015360 [Vaccinium darrowii]|uniref:Uncharacterized protein n=1 Tax=Vaccinium darrowii TaxID=229202 RepID=A0ACB7XHQ1_9ERIC|nr:hypothetical protein Vadar_015360 [Vaccinium darrowii]